MEREMNKSKNYCHGRQQMFVSRKKFCENNKEGYETVIVKAQDYFLPVRVTATLPLQC